MLRSLVGVYYLGLFALIVIAEVAQAAPPPPPPANNTANQCFGLGSQNCATFYPPVVNICKVPCVQVDANGNYPTPSPGGKYQPSGQAPGTTVCPGLWQGETWFQNEQRSPINSLANQPTAGNATGYLEWVLDFKSYCETVNFCKVCVQATVVQNGNAVLIWQCAFAANDPTATEQQSITSNYGVTGAGCVKGGS